MTEHTVTIQRFHWLRIAAGPKTGTGHISIRCPECEMLSKTTAMELPDAQGVLDFSCRSGMGLCRWQGLVQLAGWKRYRECTS